MLHCGVLDNGLYYKVECTGSGFTGFLNLFVANICYSCSPRYTLAMRVFCINIALKCTQQSSLFGLPLSFLPSFIPRLLFWNTVAYFVWLPLLCGAEYMFLMNLAVCLECRRNFRSVRCFYVVTGLKTKIWNPWIFAQHWKFVKSEFWITDYWKSNLKRKSTLRTSNGHIHYTVKLNDFLRCSFAKCMCPTPEHILYISSVFFVSVNCPLAFMYW